MNTADELREVLNKINECETLDDLIEYVQDRIAQLEYSQPTEATNV